MSVAVQSVCATVQEKLDAHAAHDSVVAATSAAGVDSADEQVLYHYMLLCASVFDCMLCS